MANHVPIQMPTQLTPEGTRMAFVGEAPASEEMKQGRPFVGSAERELDRWLQACGISRGQCFIGNLSQERAPDDKLERMFEDSKCHKPSPRLQGWIDVLKEELKVKALVTGTIVGSTPPNLMAGMDWVDTHSYWQHPHFPRRPWDAADWIVNNTSMVNERGGTLPGVALKRVVA